MNPSSWGVQRGPDGFFLGGCGLCLVEREVALRNGKLCFYWFPSCKMYGTGFSLLLHLQDVSNRWPIRVAL